MFRRFRKVCSSLFQRIGKDNLSRIPQDQNDGASPDTLTTDDQLRAQFNNLTNDQALNLIQQILSGAGIHSQIRTRGTRLSTKTTALTLVREIETGIALVAGIGYLSSPGVSNTPWLGLAASPAKYQTGPGANSYIKGQRVSGAAISHVQASGMGDWKCTTQHAGSSAWKHRETVGVWPSWVYLNGARSAQFWLDAMFSLIDLAGIPCPSHLELLFSGESSVVLQPCWEGN